MASSPHARRRAELMRRMGPDAVALFVAPPEATRSNDTTFPYRQSSDLMYLTGFPEPESALVIAPGADKERSILFVRERNPEREQWEGRRAGPEGALADLGVDAAYPIAELDQKLPELIAHTQDLYYALGVDPAMDARVAAAIHRMRLRERHVGPPPERLVDPRTLVGEMRLVKTPDELDVLRRAAAITSEAHTAAMAAARPGGHEYELQALVEYTFRKQGASGPGYSTIVGAGDNATILHYVENRDALSKGDLVLIDAGAELDGYTADVTRTFPVDGRFTPPQRDVYEIVLAAQKQAIEATVVGATVDEIHDSVVACLTDGMVSLGLLKKPAKARIKDKKFRRYYMHRTSHWLGMDVHDVGAYTQKRQARPLEPGMVLTIEPGLYIRAADERAPAKLRGIGVRIEDDILVTDKGPRSLTDATPKEIDDVEAVCSRTG